MMAWKPTDTLEFLEHCNGLGAAGIQAPLQGDPRAIRERAEQYGMYVEAFVPMSKAGDTEEFEKALQDAKAAGAVALRAACLDTRRYETFRSLGEWKAHVARSIASIEAALPLLDRYRIPLGLENHKDWTAAEALALMEKYGTEYFGWCLDFGNNVSLMDDPMDAIDKLAPYTKCVHLKDMAVFPNEDGFLLSEVPLGDGYLDVKGIVEQVRAGRPDVRLSLEMITRNPLRVPCLRDEYWPAFGERDEEALQRTLAFVHDHASRLPLPHVNGLSHEQWVAAENENVALCLRRAWDLLSSEVMHQRQP
jgi:3-oxoisoapionate decarboxylase